MTSYRIWIVIALTIALSLAILTTIHAYKADALLRHLINTFVLHERYAGSSLNLDQYRVAIEAREIAGIDDDLSGLTYNTETNTLFSVLNGQPLIVELDLEGRLLRKIKVHGVKDMEGITHVEGHRYVIVDEQDQRLLLLEISADSDAIDVTGAPQLSLGITSNVKNKDFEGVSWDDVNRRLLVVKERNPLSIVEVTGFVDGSLQQTNLNISKITPDKFRNIKLRDFSSITYHDTSGHLVLLSDESRMAAEYDFEGRAVSAIALWRGFHGLQKNVPQAEGIAIGPDKRVYIVSEPNLFYVFKPAD
jgi:uncharacterized protein YjiK